jgi:hypothetical protein
MPDKHSETELPEKIFLCRVEGKGRYKMHFPEIDGEPVRDPRTGGPLRIECLRYAEADAIPEANGLLSEWATTAPKGGAYNKTDVYLVNEGSARRLRYDLRHLSEESPDLRRFIR